MVWSGRQLTALTRDMFYHTLSFDYNADGVRIKKNNSDYVDEQWVDDTHNYVLDGSKIIKETIEHEVSSTITGTDVLYYYYDESGVAGFELNGTVYYYLKNIQGDVINILNSSGQDVVTYTYDAWGKVLSVTGTLASSVGQINPFRYRSYYYDTETGFYYLQTRYYDPEVGRFINADGIIGANGGVLGYNMFAYCNNNPVMGYDPSGERAFVIEPLPEAEIRAIEKCPAEFATQIMSAKKTFDGVNLAKDMYCYCTYDGDYVTVVYTAVETTKDFFGSKNVYFISTEYTFKRVDKSAEKNALKSKLRFYQTIRKGLDPLSVLSDISDAATINNLFEPDSIVGAGLNVYGLMVALKLNPISLINNKIEEIKRKIASTQPDYILHHAYSHKYNNNFNLITSSYYSYAYANN